MADEEEPLPEYRGDAGEESIGPDIGLSTDATTLDTIELCSANLPQIWQRILGALKGLVATHAQKSTSVAISGPNHLVLSFPKRYHVSAEYLMRSEESLRQIGQQITGQTLRFSTTLVEGPAEPEVVRPKPSPRSPLPNVEQSQDPLLRQLMQVFEGTLVRADPLPPSDDSPSEPA